MTLVPHAVTTRWQALSPQQQSRITTIAVWALLLLYPFIDTYVIGPVFGRRWLNSVTDAAVFVILALGLNIVVGFAGLLDLGYGAFFAIGAYTMGLLNSPFHGIMLGFWVVIGLAAFVAAFFGLVLGTPTLRLRGDYLAIVTLGFGEIVPIVFRNASDITIKLGPWTLVENFNLTNGVQSLVAIGRPPDFFGIHFGNDPTPWYYLVLLIGALVIVGSYRLEDSRLGRAWIAIREDELAADFMGVDPIKTKLMAFAMGASFSGLAGAVYASKLQTISPDQFRFSVSVLLLCMVILGGMGNVRGVVLGGMIIMVFDRVILAESTQIVRQLGTTFGIDALRTLDLSLWRWFFFGVTLIIVMVLRPEGLWPSKARQAELHRADEKGEPVQLRDEMALDEAIDAVYV
jgi:branched-chain amino acid transport system permease protein